MPEVSVIATSKTGNNPEIVYEEDVLDLYEMNHRFNKGYYGKKSSYAAFAEQDLKTKTIEIEKARKLIEIDSRKVVMDFNSLKKGLEISKKTVDLQTKMYEVMKLKYETGLATDSDVISSEIDLIGSKISCAETLHAYKLFIEKVKKGL